MKTRNRWQTMAGKSLGTETRSGYGPDRLVLLNASLRRPRWRSLLSDQGWESLGTSIHSVYGSSRGFAIARSNSVRRWAQKIQLMQWQSIFLESGLWSLCERSFESRKKGGQIRACKLTSRLRCFNFNGSASDKLRAGTRSICTV